MLRRGVECKKRNLLSRSERLSENGTFVHHGSSGYKAPEQYSGGADPRTDMYALGAVLYTLLTGIVPANALYWLARLRENEADPLLPLNQVVPTVPTLIADAIHRAMSINSNDRFSTV